MKEKDDAHGAREKLSVLSRRDLLKAGGVATLAATTLLANDAGAGGEEGSDFDALKTLGATRESYWRNNGQFFVQENVDASQVDQNVIRARIEGEWHAFHIRELDAEFFEFNTAMRKRMMEVMVGAKPFTIYNDGHNAAVGTYGSNRGDSRFTINVAYKGMGWVPKPSRIDERIAMLEQHYAAEMMPKMQILHDGYSDTALWDLRLQGSLELYTTPEFETHTFLNQMVNPVSTLCFLGDESYEIRTIARLMHYNDPALSEYERKVVKFINFAHDFFHGGPDPNRLTIRSPAVAYWVIEEFDNSPMGATETACGRKRVPLP